MVDIEKMEDDEDIITLTDEDGKDIDFVEVAGIVYKGKYYAILQPVELLDGMEEDDALVFLVEGTDREKQKFSIVLEDEIIEGVFKEYNRLLDETCSKDLEN